MVLKTMTKVMFCPHLENGKGVCGIRYFRAKAITLHPYQPFLKLHSTGGGGAQRKSTKPHTIQKVTGRFLRSILKGAALL